MAKKVYVGMSGGVDSSVTAALLKEQGYDVTGVYMKNWSQDLPGFICPWKEDYQDAKRVAVQLGIPFKMYDFEKEYRQKVVDYMIDEYKAGRTPNPDIMCNQEVKFKLFLNTALEDGADMIATGHYARIVHEPRGGSPGGDPAARSFSEDSGGNWTDRTPRVNEDSASLLAGLDKNKDQSYFLYRVTEDALKHSLMPIGEYEKPQVRELAKKFGLVTAEKKDSQGICFVGKVGIKEFLEQFVETQPGNIVDRSGKVIGEHEGALFYTIGQRHGLDVGGGLPYYVIGKDMAKNEVYVTTDLQDKGLWSDSLILTGMHWINGEPSVVAGARTLVRTRYRAPLVPVQDIKKQADGTWRLQLGEEVRALTPGQSAVLYGGDRVLGGGIVV
ncbi:MAG TPA: tRNA 2-thiouridine(34) synthase MnmA [Candidatus Saccharimonadales bacterium]|nr:tRNA 2-thiouridine(34) synthase MnmA [Candidatus Saccharimonadales bacterium]